jgi:hypothetical protein
MHLSLYIKNKYCRLYFANWCQSWGNFFQKWISIVMKKKCLFPVRCTILFLYFSCLQEYEGRMETYGIPVDHFSLSSLGVNLASSPHIINSRQVRKYSPLCRPQYLGSINSYLLIHQLQTGQKILPSLKYSVPWEYKIICISSHS